MSNYNIYSWWNPEVNLILVNWPIRQLPFAVLHAVQLVGSSGPMMTPFEFPINTCFFIVYRNCSCSSFLFQIWKSWLFFFFFESCYHFQKLKDQFKLSVSELLFAFSNAWIFPCSFSTSLLCTHKETLIPSIFKILCGKAVCKITPFHLPVIYAFIQQLNKKQFFFFLNHKEPNVCLKAHVKVIGCSNEGIMEHFKYAFER